MPKDEKGLPVPDEILNHVDFSQGLEIYMKSTGVVFIIEE